MHLGTVQIRGQSVNQNRNLTIGGAINAESHFCKSAGKVILVFCCEKMRDTLLWSS